MNRRNNFKYWISILIFFVISQSSFATSNYCDGGNNDCFSDIFGDGLQSNSASGKVLFGCGSQLQNSPDNKIEAPCVGSLLTPSSCSAPNCSPKTCENVKCIANTATPFVGTLSTAFPSFSGGSSVTNPTTLSPGTYNNVSIGKDATFSCSGCNNTGVAYKINTLTFTGSKTLTLQPGNYYIKNIVTPSQTSLKIRTPGKGGDGSGTVRVFLNNGSTPAVFSTAIDWNSDSCSASRSLIYAFQGLNITGNGEITSFIYSPLDIDLGVTLGSSDLELLGAVTARNITVGSLNTNKGDTVVKYDETLPDFGPISCSDPSTTQFSITGLSGAASSCTSNILTVTAQKSDGTTDTTYTGTVVLSTKGSCTSGSICTGTCTSGGNTCKGTFNLTTGSGACSGCGGNNGYIEYTFVAADAGVAKFSLIYPPEGVSPTNIVVYQKDNSTINGILENISFNPSQFVMIASTDTMGTTSPTPYNVTQVAGAVFNPAVKLVAYSPCGVGVATNYSGNKTIQFYSTYVDPTPSNTIGTKVVVNGTAIANSSAVTATTQTINFNSGVATLNSVKYSDVGKIVLTAKDNTTAPVMSGSSGNIVVKPYNFVISGTGIPGTTSPSGSIFGKAGQPFTATVTVLTSDGMVAGSYGNESTAEGIKLQSASMAAPSGGRNGSDNLGTIGNATAFSKVSPGVFKGTSFTFDEVGSINLRARVKSGSYLSAGDVVGATALVGRFTPDHFDVTGNSPQFATGCTAGSFTYLDQPFVYSLAPTITVQAKAYSNPISSNYVTQNYKGDFKKLSPTQFSALNQDYQPGNTSTLSIDKTGANLPVPTEIDSGVGTLSYTFAASAGLSNQGLKLNRPAAAAAPNAPLNANIQLRLVVKDTDNIAYLTNPFVFGAGTGIGFNNGATFYHGRLLMSNASGSEIKALNVPMQVQYYNGSSFVPNTTDSCTSISSTTYLLLTDPPSPQIPINVTASLPIAGFISGGSNILLSAPNVSGQKNIEVNLSTTAANKPWLQGNWPFQPGIYANPQAQANFGTFKGTSSVIYQRENYP
jgi:hypothetical protein